MFKSYYPYEYVKSVFSIDYNKLYNNGYRGLIFDIDNTLVHHGDDSTEDVDMLFKDLQNMGFQTVLLTNNNEERVKRFIQNIDTHYICNADKPKTHGYIEAVKIMNISKNEAVFIGDQIFTDILGANRSGIPNILVKFIQVNENEKIGKKRQVENILLKFYSKSKKYTNRLGNIEKES